VAQNYKSLQRLVWQYTLLWPIIVNKTIVQQNRIKSLHHNGNTLNARSPSIIIIITKVLI